MHIHSNSYANVPSMINAIDISPDESQIALAGFYNTVWDFNTGNYLGSLSCDGYSIEYSSDGKSLAIGQKNEVNIYETDNLQHIHNLDLGDTSYLGWGLEVTAIAFAPDNNQLCCFQNQKLYLWDCDQNNILKIMNISVGYRAKRIDFYNGNENVLIGSKFYNLNSEQEIDDDLYTPNTSFKFSDNKVYLRTAKIEIENEEMLGLMFEIYDYAKQTLFTRFLFEKDSFIDDTLSPNAKLIAISNLERTQIIDISVSEFPQIVRTYPASQTGQIRHIKFTKDGNKIVLASFYDVLIYDISDLNTCVENAVLH